MGTKLLKHISMGNKNAIVIGAGGHASVLIEGLDILGYQVLGVSAPSGNAEKVSSTGLLILGGDQDIIDNYSPQEVVLFNGIGSVSDVTVRKNVFEGFLDAGFEFPAFIHPSAFVSSSAIIGSGVQVFANSVVNSQATIGDNTIINTGSVIEHHNQIGKHCHVAPNATCCGQVTVGDESHIGAGAVIIQGLEIGSKTVVGAGSVVVKDITDGAVVKGVPAV